MQDTYLYPALFETCEEGGYTVTFPDLPGIVTEGDTLDEAISMAKEALSLHMLGMERDGDLIPPPTAPQKLLPPKDAFFSLVEAYLPPLRKKRANRSVNKMVTLPAWLKEEVDRRGINVSQILQQSLIQHLGLKTTLTQSSKASRTKPTGNTTVIIAKKQSQK